jgi:hypothetical protein
MATATQTKRDIIMNLRTKDHAAYMVTTGAPMDSIVCPQCLTADSRGSDIKPLTYIDLCVIFRAEGAIQFPVCDVCGRDLSEVTR